MNARSSSENAGHADVGSVRETAGIATRARHAGHICRTGRRGEAGAVLLLVIFLAAAMLIAMSVSVPRLVMQGRREKEAELAWRGEQYVRAIRLYYRKYGHFPRTVEDFSKNPGNLHFLRKEYKDPMNTTDGTWRFIYIGPGGQLIGSLTRTLPLGVVPLQLGAGGVLGSTSNTGLGGATIPGQPGIAPGGGTQSGSQSAQGQPPTPPAGNASSGTGAGGDQSGDAALPPAPVAPNQASQGASTSDSTVFGGQLVGVGSKVDRKSIRFYKGYGKYREWEFIWDPAAEAAAAGGLVPVPPGGQLPVGTPPIGTQPIGTTPTNPPQ
jgi:hypothetical protein